MSVSEVDRLLIRQHDEIERATGLHLRVRRALVRDPGKPRPFSSAPGLLTTDFAEIQDDPAIQLVAERYARESARFRVPDEI